jgi:hypothetical protein
MSMEAWQFVAGLATGLAVGFAAMILLGIRRERKALEWAVEQLKSHAEGLVEEPETVGESNRPLLRARLVKGGRRHRVFMQGGRVGLEAYHQLFGEVDGAWVEGEFPYRTSKDVAGRQLDEQAYPNPPAVAEVREFFAARGHK